MFVSFGFLPVFNALPYINEKNYQKNIVFALGQNIYTPTDTDADVLIKDDRPYAGWLYLGLGVVWKDASSAACVSGACGPVSQNET